MEKETWVDQIEELTISIADSTDLTVVPLPDQSGTIQPNSSQIRLSPVEWLHFFRPSHQGPVDKEQAERAGHETTGDDRSGAGHLGSGIQIRQSTPEARLVFLWALQKNLAAHPAQREHREDSRNSPTSGELHRCYRR